MAKLNLLLAEFSEQHRLGRLSADEKGVYCIVIDDMQVSCFERFGKGYFYSRLATLPERANNLPVVLKNLMNHALFRAKSQSCCLGLGKDGDLLLFERFDIEFMSLHDFCETLERFSNALEEYRHFADSKDSEYTSAHAMIITP